MAHLKDKVLKLLDKYFRWFRIAIKSAPFYKWISNLDRRIFVSLLVTIFTFSYILGTRSGGNSNIQYYVSWAQDIFHQRLLDSYHIKDGRSISAEIGELVVPYTPLTLYFFYISARVVFLFSKESFSNYIVVVNSVAVLSTFLTAFSMRKIGANAGFNPGLIFLITPTVILFSPILGFQDSLMTLFLILGIYFATKQRFLLAGTLLACSIWTKQLALMPVVSIFLVYIIHRKWRLLLKLSIAAGVSTFMILFPFIISGNLRAYLESQALTSVHTMLSAQATNFPYLASLLMRIKMDGVTSGFSQGGYGLRLDDDLIRQTIYLSLGLTTVSLFVYWLYKYSKLSNFESMDLWLVASFMIFTYYIFNAGVHENHAFAALPMLLLINNRKLGLKLYLISSTGLGLHLLITSGLGSTFPQISQALTLSGSSATLTSLVVLISYLYCYRLLWQEGVGKRQLKVL